MKKILMGTSAIAFAGVNAGSAQAAEWDLDWGGFYNAYAVYTDEDLGSGQDGFDILTNGEVHFTPSITLDNGLTFGAVVELEGSDDTGIDDNFLFITGSFGRVEMGNEGSVYGQMIQGGSGYALQGPAGVHSGSMTGTFLAGSQYGNYNAAGFGNQIDGDAVRINYYTPRFSGFQVGVSYARGGSPGDRFFEDRDAVASDIMSVSANYVNNFGNFDLAASVGYETADESGAGDLDRYNVGLGLGFGGFLVGAAYSHSDGTNTTTNDTEFYDVGVGYATGPWGVSLGYSLTDPDGSSNDTQQVALNGSYQLGTGVTAVAFVGYADDDANNVDGFTIGTGFHLGF